MKFFKINKLKFERVFLNLSQDKIVNKLGYINFFIMIFLICISFFMSIYPDELTYLIQGKRLFLDNYHLYNVSIQCNEHSFNAPVSSFLFRFIDSLLYSFATPIIIRIYGIVVFLVWMFFLSLSLKKFYKTPWQFFTLFNLGVFPFALIINRPESNMIMGIMALTCLYEYSIPKKQWNKKEELFFLLIYFFISSYIFSSHSKAPGFLPFTILMLIPLTIKWPTKCFAAMTSIFSALEHYYFFIARANFKGCSTLGDIVSGLYMKPTMIFGNFKHFIKQGVHNLFDLSSSAIKHMLLSNNFQGDWLEGFNINKLDSAYNFFTLLTLRILIFSTLALFLYRFFKNIKRPNQYLISASLIISILAIRMLENYSHWYLIPLYFPIIILVFLREFSFIFKEKGINFLVVVFTVISIINTVFLTINFYPQIQRNLAQTVDKLNRPIPFAKRDFFVLSKKIQDFAYSKCGITENSQKLVLDDVTYYSFVSSKQPLSLHYLVGFWGKDIPNLKKLLTEQHSDGLVLNDCTPIAELSGSLGLIYDSVNPYCCAKAFK